VPQIVVAHAGAVCQSELLAGNVVFVTIDEGPESAGCSREPAGENAGLNSWCMRLPCGIAKIVRHRPLDTRESQDGFRIIRVHPIPEPPKIFQDGVTRAVKEGVLQAIGLVPCKAVGNIHGVAWLQPSCFVHHWHEGVLLPFPGDPIVPANVSPGERLIARFELRFERERVAGGVGREPEFCGNALECVEIDAIRSNVRQKLRDRNPRKCTFLACALVPDEDWEEHSHASTVELLDHLAKRWDAAGQVAQEVELAAIVHPQIGIDMPDEDRVYGSDAALGLGQESVNRVFTFLGIVEAAVPNQQLHLGEDMLSPLQLWTVVLRAVVAKANAAVVSPRFEPVEPGGSISRLLRPGKKDFARRGHIRQIHNAGCGDEGVARLPLVRERQAGQEENQSAGEQDAATKTDTVHGCSNQ
jgi:hypothetical protein